MMERSRTDYSILNIVAGLGGYAVNTVIGLICRMVFTRTLAEEYLGVNGLFTSILGMLSLAELGIGSAIVYALYKPLAERNEEKIATLVQFYGRCYRAIGLFIGLVGLCLTPVIELLVGNQGSGIEKLKLIYLLYLFNTASSYFFSYRSSLLVAAQRNYLVVGLNYVVTIAQSLVQMVLLFVTKNYMSYLLTQCICTMIYNVWISHAAKQQFPFIVRRDAPPMEPQERKSLMSNVWALTVWKLSGLLVNQTDSIIITWFSGLATVGLSSNYTLLSTTLNSLLNQLFSGITASVGNHNALESSDRQRKLFRAINLANFWLYGWGAIGVALVSSDMVAVLFGGEFVLHWSIPLIMAVNFYTVGIQNAVWTYNNTLGLFRQGRYLLLVTAGLNLWLSIWWGQLWGLFGILFATTVARLLTNIWFDPYKLYRHGFHADFREYVVQYVLYLLILGVTGGLCWILCALMPQPSGLSIGYKFTVCSVLPNGLFFLCFRKKPEFVYMRELAMRVLSKVRGLLRR